MTERRLDMAINGVVVSTGRTPAPRSSGKAGLTSITCFAPANWTEILVLPAA
ncbi:MULTISPECIES: hypothetical protein [Sphingomonas]|uniref:Uncharacterized protein n=1 Tax=Sphingomonas paucimobilis TaxID=13689 RepID=A0A7Y2PEF9_SPHPI|nr:MULTISPECIES: hypothetical protein [Sphingomonas]MCM3680755.1 hypothetical protein [Sphingomonas paucimobilis]NNG59871.1 hypothetical protein [Sphingomonas paucimobilis]QPS15753.1 hypothetical protein I6G65_15765 [Sphingomonas paucimobilis]QPT07247.1 hypothetical protein I6G38_10205 [Sphingomonas paucimobilis]